MMLCHIDDIEEEAAKGFHISAERQVFAIKKEGQISLFENRCPHLGIPLEMLPDQFLDSEKCYIQCSTHGALFEIDSGLCVAGPCHGASLTHVPFVISDGEIHLKK